MRYLREGVRLLIVGVIEATALTKGWMPIWVIATVIPLYLCALVSFGHRIVKRA